MTDRNPIVDILAEATTDIQRQAWLETVPEGMLKRDMMAIDAVLEGARFEAGRMYLATMVAKIDARRLGGGRHPHTVLAAVEHARIGMTMAVRAGINAARGGDL